MPVTNPSELAGCTHRSAVNLRARAGTLRLPDQTCCCRARVASTTSSLWQAVSLVRLAGTCRRCGAHSTSVVRADAVLASNCRKKLETVHSGVGGDGRQSLRHRRWGARLEDLSMVKWNRIGCTLDGTMGRLLLASLMFKAARDWRTETSFWQL